MAEPNWNNRTLFVADNIRILRGMNSESVDCIATDPPFNKKRIFNVPLGSGGFGAPVEFLVGLITD